MTLRMLSEDKEVCGRDAIEFEAEVLWVNNSRIGNSIFAPALIGSSFKVVPSVDLTVAHDKTVVAQLMVYNLFYLAWHIFLVAKRHYARSAHGVLFPFFLR